MGKYFVRQEFKARPGEIGRKPPAERMRDPDARGPYMLYGLFRGEDSVDAVGFAQFVDSLRPLAHAPRVLFAEPASVGSGVVEKVRTDFMPSPVGISADEARCDGAGARIDEEARWVAGFLARGVIDFVETVLQSLCEQTEAESARSPCDSGASASHEESGSSWCERSRCDADRASLELERLPGPGCFQDLDAGFDSFTATSEVGAGVVELGLEITDSHDI